MKYFRKYQEYYTYSPEGGSDGHMAGEIIARAARHLGAPGADARIAQCVGLASHPIPQGDGNVRIRTDRADRDIVRRMDAALEAARRELAWLPDCPIEVVRERTTVEEDDGAFVDVTTVSRHVRRREWRVVSTWSERWSAERIAREVERRSHERWRAEMARRGARA